MFSYFFHLLSYVIPPSVCEDWNLYPQFIAWVGFHLLYQHRSSYALKHSFCYFLALKSSATDAAEREQRVLAHFAESRGGKATLVVD